MPRRASASLLLALACASPVLLGASALAAPSGDLTPSGTGWVSRPVTQQYVSGPLAPVNGYTTVPSTTATAPPDGDLSVSGGYATDGEPGKESYVAFDLTSLDPSTTTVSSLALHLVVDSAYTAGTSTTTAVPPLEACRVTGHFFRVDDGDWASRPPSDCSDAVTATFDAPTQTYTFELKPFLAAWLASSDANEGVAIRPPAGYGPTALDQPFDLAFVGSKVTGTLAAVTAAVAAPVAAVDATVTTVATAVKPAATAPRTTTSVASAPAAAATGIVRGVPVALPSELTGVGPETSATVVEAPTLAAAVAGPATAPRATTTIRPAAVSAPFVSAQGAVPLFWVALGGGVLLLVAVSWVTGSAGPVLLRR